MKLQRIQHKARPNWQEILRKEGCRHFYHDENTPYWLDHVYWKATESQIDIIEKATNDLQQVCLQAVTEIVKRGDLYDRFMIPQKFHAEIERSWNDQDPHLYGRFDFSWDGENDTPKMLEYNADTPTTLVEASVSQWTWIENNFGEEVHETIDQFNCIHDDLIARWKEISAKIGNRIHFSCMDSEDPDHEDVATIEYFMDTAIQAGLSAHWVAIPSIAYNAQEKLFYDHEGRKIQSLFKLYPWEWMMREEFGEHLIGGKPNIIEPAWKALLSNKAILPILWEMFPGHPNLLPSFFEASKLDPKKGFAEKPIFGREGSNVKLFNAGKTTENDGPFKEGGILECSNIYQEICPLYNPEKDVHLMIGSWVIGNGSSGLTFRESSGPITDHTERFVPHVFTYGE